MRVVVAGGSGYVGRALVGSLAAGGHEPIVVSRSAKPVEGARSVAWDQLGVVVDGSDAVVNLAGASIGSLRWTTRRKRAIVASRVQTTARLLGAIGRAAGRPAVFVTASGIGFAGDAGDTPVDKSSPYGTDFLAQVCKAWEQAAAASPVRHVAVRTALVVGRYAPSIRLMTLPYRAFLGGRLGSGTQWFPWIHVDDAVRVYREAIENASLSGPVNAVAPQRVRQADVAEAIGSVLHRPAVVPTPTFALRALLGEQADMLLHGQRARSVKLRGFEFRYRALGAALADALA